MPRQSKDTVAVLGIDIGKNVFHLIGLDKRGAIVLRQKLSRGQLEARLANMPPCLIGMEACVGAHHLSRKLKVLGHEPRLMPAKYVKAFLKGNKNDFRDAEAIAEAVQRPTMRFVATKTAEQLDLQALHRVRSRLVSQRTAIVNEIRAFLLDRGIASQTCWRSRSPTSWRASPGACCITAATSRSGKCQKPCPNPRKPGAVLGVIKAKPFGWARNWASLDNTSTRRRRRRRRSG